MIYKHSNKNQCQVTVTLLPFFKEDLSSDLNNTMVKAYGKCCDSERVSQVGDAGGHGCQVAEVELELVQAELELVQAELELVEEGAAHHHLAT